MSSKRTFIDNGHEEDPEGFQFLLSEPLTEYQLCEFVRMYPECDYESDPDHHFINGRRHEARGVAYRLKLYGYSGCWFDYNDIKDNGKPIMRNADGTRSIFCDLADDMEDN